MTNKFSPFAILLVAILMMVFSSVQAQATKQAEYVLSANQSVVFEGTAVGKAMAEVANQLRENPDRTVRVLIDAPQGHLTSLTAGVEAFLENMKISAERLDLRVRPAKGDGRLAILQFAIVEPKEQTAAFELKVRR